MDHKENLRREKSGFPIQWSIQFLIETLSLYLVRNKSLLVISPAVSRNNINRYVYIKYRNDDDDPSMT